jgi:hypothetical protein
MAILTGTAAMAIVVVIGVLQNARLEIVVIQGLAAAIAFGAGGLIIGNLLQTYVFSAAQREAARLAIRKEIEKEMARQARESEAEEEEESVED